MTSTVFLIGATGGIGSALLSELAPDHAAGRVTVKAAAHSDRSRKMVEAKGIKPVAFDLNRPATFAAALRGVETVFLLRPYTLRQMMQAKSVTDAARKAGVRAIVSIGAYGRADTPWSVIGWNFLVEAYIERSGLAYTHLQPNYFMDNVLLQRDATAGILYNGIGVPVSWIAASDIAAVAAAVLRNPAEHAGKTYKLASEVADTAQIAAYMSEITGVSHKVGIPDPDRLMKRLLAQGREPEYAIALNEYVDAVSRGEVPEIADIFDTVEAIAGRPATKFQDFLKSRLQS